MSDHNSFAGGPSRMLRQLRQLSREQEARDAVKLVAGDQAEVAKAAASQKEDFRGN